MTCISIRPLRVDNNATVPNGAVRLLQHYEEVLVVGAADGGEVAG